MIEPPTPTAAIRDRIKAEYLRLDALVAICESDLHRAPIGCPSCQRDERQMDLLRDVDAALAASERSRARLREALTRTEDYIRTAMKPQSIAAACSETAYDRAHRAGLQHALNAITVEFSKAIAALRTADAPPATTTKCPEMHVWTHQFGDDWTPQRGDPCDCGARRYGWESWEYANAGLPAPATTKESGDK